MAEAIVNHYYGDIFEAESAGLEAGTLNPLAIEAMKEIEIDISGNKTKKVFDFYKEGRLYGYVITVCDEASSEKCPVFPGITERVHWSFPDPAVFTGSHEEKLAKTREVRDNMKLIIDEWAKQVKQTENGKQSCCIIK